MTQRESDSATSLGETASAVRSPNQNRTRKNILLDESPRVTGRQFQAEKMVNEPKWRNRSDGVVGNRRVGSRHEINRENRRGRTEFMAPRPEEPPGGSQSVRSSDEAE
jgi:hypothetical protein